MGVLAYMFWKNRSRPRVSRATFTLLEAVGAAASLTIVSLAGAGPLSFLCPPVFVATILIFAYEGGAVSSLLVKRPLALVGSLSYSIYMVHMFVQARLLNVIDVASKLTWLPVFKEQGKEQTLSNNVSFATDAVILVMVTVIIACAYLTYTYIENPIRKWSRYAILSQKVLAT
jgi:peptidoglycan/LPS O-acetylase OafA/YrhL